MKKLTALALATMLASTGAQALEAEKNIVQNAIVGIQDAMNAWKDSDEGDYWVELADSCFSAMMSVFVYMRGGHPLTAI